MLPLCSVIFGRSPKSLRSSNLFFVTSLTSPISDFFSQQMIASQDFFSSFFSQKLTRVHSNAQKKSQQQKEKKQVFFFWAFEFFLAKGDAVNLEFLSIVFFVEIFFWGQFWSSWVGFEVQIPLYFWKWKVNVWIKCMNKYKTVLFGILSKNHLKILIFNNLF
jgi:hypothetical protein